MESIEYIRATVADIPEILRMRHAFAEEIDGAQPEETTRMLEANLTEYFTRELNKNYFHWFTTVNGEMAAMAGMIIRTQPGNPKNPSGRWGYLMLVYTKPQFRKRGISGQLVERLVETAKELGITALELHATPEGAPLYERKGFSEYREPTYRMFI